MLVDILDLPADRGQEVPKHSRQESDSVNEATKHIRQETVQIELKPSQKWIVLGLFVINSLLNAWGAQTISASPNQSMQLFPGLTESGINTILLYSAVLPFLGMMPCAALLVSKEGVHRCIQVGSILVAVGLCLRSFPAFLSTETRIEHSTTCLSLLHVGQFLNAAAFPFFYGLAQLTVEEMVPSVNAYYHNRRVICGCRDRFCLFLSDGQFWQL